MDENIIALDDGAYEVEFMNLVVDKADNLKVVDSDSHFRKFTGVHPSKIKQGKLFLHDFIKPVYREKIMKILCKKILPMCILRLNFWIKAVKVYLYTAQVRTGITPHSAGSHLLTCQNHSLSRSS